MNARNGQGSKKKNFLLDYIGNIETLEIKLSLYNVFKGL